MQSNARWFIYAFHFLCALKGFSFLSEDTTEVTHFYPTLERSGFDLWKRYLYFGLATKCLQVRIDGGITSSASHILTSSKSISSEDDKDGDSTSASRTFILVPNKSKNCERERCVICSRRIPI